MTITGFPRHRLARPFGWLALAATTRVGDELARIRTIKPEFWSSPGHKGRGPWVRLLYIAMWNWADDFGRGTASPKELGGFAFPEDENISPTDVRRMLGEIQRAYDVVFYEVAGRPYYFIPSWEKHQKIDRRSQPRYPAPEDGTPFDPDPPRVPDATSDLREVRLSADLAGGSADPAESTAEAAGVSALEVGTGDQGNRGSTSVLAVGERTVRNARTREAPSAQPGDLLARRVIAGIPRYRDAPRWVRRRLVPLAATALAAGFGPDAITGYAVMVITEVRFKIDQHIPELRDALRRLSRDAALGTACRSCGFDPGGCPCTAPAQTDRPWTEADQAALERAMEHLGVEPGELGRGA
jgi:hypothetical protein